MTRFRSWDGGARPVLQHDTGHLDGVLFGDWMDAATRKLAMREIRAS